MLVATLLTSPSLLNPPDLCTRLPYSSPPLAQTPQNLTPQPCQRAEGGRRAGGGRAGRHAPRLPLHSRSHHPSALPSKPRTQVSDLGGGGGANLCALPQTHPPNSDPLTLSLSTLSVSPQTINPLGSFSPLGPLNALSREREAGRRRTCWSPRSSTGTPFAISPLPTLAVPYFRLSEGGVSGTTEFVYSRSRVYALCIHDLTAANTDGAISSSGDFRFMHKL